MDEIDAALDFRNVSIVANYIKDRTKNAQFIIISLRWAIFLIFVLALFIRLQKRHVWIESPPDRDLQDVQPNEKYVALAFNGE